MSQAGVARWMLGTVLVVGTATGLSGQTGPINDLQNPYQTIEGGPS